MAEVTTNKKVLGIGKYFKDIKSEMKKVVWPSFSKTKNNTLIVIVYMIIIAIIIAILDVAFSSVVRYLTSGELGFGTDASAAIETAKLLF